MIPWEPTEMDAPLARKGIEDALRLKGVKTMPGNFNTGGLQPVYNLGAGGFMAPAFSMQTSGQLTGIVGSNNAIVAAIGPTGFTVSGLIGTPQVNLLNQNARILSARARLDFDAAGALAFNGKTIRVNWEVRDFDNSPNYAAWLDDFTIATAILAYRRPLNSPFWRGLVPLTSAFTVGFQSVDGTVFPANTTCQIDYSVAVCGVGTEVPY